MGKLRSLFGVMTVILLYFAGAAFASAYVRLNGGFAMVWLSSAVLAAWMIATERRRWPAGLAGCGVAHVVASGCFGIGWAVSPFMAVVTLAEATAAAVLTRKLFNGTWQVAAFTRVAVFAVGIMVVIPLGSGLIAATAAHLLKGLPFGSGLHSWVLGRGVGMGAILPFAMTVTTRISGWGGNVADRRRERDTASMTFADRHRAPIALLILATMAAVCLGVFLQDARWTLLAPLLVAVFAAIWVDAIVATAMPLMVATIAAPLSVAGFGPLATGLTAAADRLQIGLLYAALIVCCSLPVVADRARRRQEVARLSRSAAHFEAMSQRADNLIDELRRAALTDPLTSLPNRRAFFDALNAHAASDEPACLAMIDLDHFKRVNDRHGHAAGDSVLVEFAEIARSSFRCSDVVARIGGEEFAVILRHTTPDQARLIVQRLVDRLAATDIVTESGPLRVTISSGVSLIDGDGRAALARADEALYAAKRAGRCQLAMAA